MSKKGFDFNLEIENVKDDEKFNNEVMIKEIQKLVDTTPFPIKAVGFYENSGNLAVEGQVCRDTKKEAEAEYTIFKEKARIFEKVFLLFCRFHCFHFIFSRKFT